jgi:hypothetical protein
MTLQEAKDAVAFKYYREKWNTMTSREQANVWDEVAELYASSKADKSTERPVDEGEKSFFCQNDVMDNGDRCKIQCSQCEWSSK